MTRIMIINGVQMIVLGIIGEYLWRTLAQVQRCDMYVIDSVYERDKQDSSPPSSALVSRINQT